MRKLALILSILVSFDVSAQLQVVSKSFVTWHGAKGDGITDDTAAFQRGINAAQANGSVLIVPPGIYSLTEVTNTSGITIEGVEGAVLLQATNNLVGLQQTIMWSVISSSTNANLNHTNITFRGLTFKGRVDNDGFYEFSFLLGILGANNVLIEDCSFIGTRGDGIYLASYAGSHNRNITVRNCYFDGI